MIFTKILQENTDRSLQQFPLTIRLMGALQSADRFCNDEFIALDMDEELQKRDASVMRPATDSQGNCWSLALDPLRF